MADEFEVKLDESGWLVIPEALAKKHDLRPGTPIRLEDNTNGAHFRRPVTHLARVYIEPTNHCNLECVPACVTAGMSRWVRWLQEHSPEFS